MEPVTTVSMADHSIDIARDFSITPTRHTPGPPNRMDGFTLGIVEMHEDAPHGGEIHPNGDEFLYVISGRLSVTCEARPGETLELGPGDGCIVKKNEWHNVCVLEPAKLIHLTPGPDGDHRPVGYTPP